MTAFGCEKIGTNKVKKQLFFPRKVLSFKGSFALLHCSHILNNLNMVFLLILCWQTYPNVAKASTHNTCMLYIDPLLLFKSAWWQSWSHFVALLPPTKYFCITPCLPILVELIHLVNSVIIILSQMTLLRWLTYLLRSQTLILTVLLFWRYFFLLTLVFLKLDSGEFWQNASNLLNKGKSAMPPLFNGQEVLSSASSAAKSVYWKRF